MIRRLALAAALLAPSPALAWGTHYLVTDRAVDRPDMAYLDEQVTVEPLSAFLAAQPNDVKAAIDQFYDWEAQRGSKRFARQTFDVANPTVDAFLKATRLNPKTQLAEVVRLLPGEALPESPVALATISPYLKDTPPLLTVFRAANATETARSVFVTYADEPDWGMDHELWDTKEYGYGEEPYGKPTGESSKAAFHMLFAHENGIVRKFAPAFTEGMVVDRVEQALLLSKAAFATGHRYWGYRFAAWAAHYVEDVGQPYHSRTVPSAGTMYYVRYIVSPAKDRMVAKTTAVEGNRHYAYEDFVSYSVQQAYTSDATKPLAAFLASGDAAYPVADAASLVEAVGAKSADHAKTIDGTIVKAFGPKITKDWHYDVETAADYHIADVVAQMPKDKADLLLAQTGQDFQNTGEGARTVLALAGAGAVAK